MKSFDIAVKGSLIVLGMIFYVLPVRAISFEDIDNTTDNNHTAILRAISIGDVDDNGTIDMVGESSGLQFGITHNIAGTSDFEDQTHLSPIQYSIFSSELVDLDGDGDLDFITGGPNGSPGSSNYIYYWDNVTNKRYEYSNSAYSIGGSGIYAKSLVTGDFIEDGKADIIWFTDTNAYLAKNTSTGTDININFTGLSSFNTQINDLAYGNQSTSIGDFNGDDHLDFIIAAYDSALGGTYSVGLGDGMGNFTIISGGNLGDNFRSYAVEVGDFNLDGKDDFVLTRNNYSVTDAEVYVYLRNVTNDGFDAIKILWDKTYTYNYVAVNDVNFDGYPDFIAITNNPGNTNNTMPIHLNNGDGTFDAEPDSTLTTTNAYQIWIEDINNDKKPDLIQSATGENGIGYFYQSTLTWNLNYIASTGGSISGKASQIVENSESGSTVSAVPDTGYEFSKWSDGGTNASRTDLEVTSDLTVTAEFYKKAVAEDPDVDVINTENVGSTDDNSFSSTGSTTSENRYTSTVEQIDGKSYVSRVQVKVIDDRDIVVPNIKITLVPGNQSSVTNQNGFAIFDDIEIGEYVLTLEYLGQTYKKEFKISEPEEDATEVTLRTIQVRVNSQVPEVESRVESAQTQKAESNNKLPANLIPFFCAGILIPLFFLAYRRRKNERERVKKI